MSGRHGGVTIRPIEAGDADAYVAVFEAVAAEGRWIGTELPIQPDRRARLRAAATDPPEGSFTNVAVVDDHVVGFANVHIERGRAQLGMAIIDGYRGLGIGRQLLDGCIDWSRASGAHKVDLEV